jgi:histidyl-tRNA synthetase
MADTLQPLRGTKDLWGTEAQQFSRIHTSLERTAYLFDATEVRTPIIETLGVFARTLGETSDVVAKEMYVFQDRNGDPIALRPEGTAGVMRAFIHAGLYDKLPLNVYYSGAMFRYERPQKGRQRQFHQAGMEFLGASRALSDAQAIAAAWAFLKDIGLDTNALRLEINTLGTPPERALYQQHLIAYFENNKDQLSVDSQRRLHTNPLRILDSKDAADQALLKDAPRLFDALGDESKQYFAQVMTLLAALGIAPVHNHHLVRGLDYYSHTTFEITTTALGAQGTVLAGGRYDGLSVMMGGKPVAAIGWAAGMERLALLMPEAAPAAGHIAVLALGTAQEQTAVLLAQTLRNAGHCVQVYTGDNLGKILTKVVKRNARSAVFVGATEVAQGIVTVKDLQTGVQQTISNAQLLSVV